MSAASSSRPLSSSANPTYWSDIAGQAERIDALIEEFNAKTGLVMR